MFCSCRTVGCGRCSNEWRGVRTGWITGRVAEDPARVVRKCLGRVDHAGESGPKQDVVQFKPLIRKKCFLRKKFSPSSIFPVIFTVFLMVFSWLWNLPVQKLERDVNCTLWNAKRRRLHNENGKSLGVAGDTGHVSS